MGLLESYTLSELETESGFDKRTIAYYISEGLLPKVGRRGPRTRYPLDFLERLMFIRRVRDMQDDGKLRAVMLTEIRDVINQLTADEISAAARKGSSVRWIRDRFENPDWDTSELAVAPEDVAAAMPSEPEPDSWGDDVFSASVADRGVPYKTKMVSARQRRDSLKEQMTFSRSQEHLDLEMENRQEQVEEFSANPERAMAETIITGSQPESRMEKRYYEMHENLLGEMREMKGLIFEMREQLRKLEDRIKQDRATGENDTDIGED
jgi:DNA-binding transcriptional MerR regulator